MKKLLFLFILSASCAQAQNDSASFFVYADNNNNAIYEPGLGEHPVINYCLTLSYMHNVNQTSQFSFKTDVNGKYTIRNLTNLVLPANNMLYRNVGFPSDVQYQNQIFSNIQNLPYNTLNSIPLYSVFGFKDFRLAAIGVVNSPGLSGLYTQYCMGRSALCVSTSAYCRNYKDLIPNTVPFTYTVTNGTTTNVYNDVVNIVWPAGGQQSCGAGGGAFYLQPIPEMSAVGIYTLSFNGLSFSNIGYNDGYPGLQTLSMIVDSCSVMIGNVYVECSNDCYRGGTEYASSDEVITSTNGTYTTIAIPDYNGNYNVTTPYSATQYTLTATPNAGFTFTCSSNPITTYYSNAGANSITRYDQLAQTTTSNVNCYANINAPTMGAVPGATFQVSPYYGIAHPDYCSVLNHAGKFYVKFDTNVSFVSVLSPIAPTYSVYTLASGDSVVWTIPDLRAYANNMNGSVFQLNVFMKTTAIVGNNYCMKAGIISAYPETSFSDNELSNCWLIGGPFDPNYKEVSPKGTGAQGYIPQGTTDMLYTIHFQNVGTAPAVNVKIKDLLDSDLNLSSFQVIGSSHPVQTNLDANGQLTFLFDGILLPDSTHDEPHSHGFVSYKIRLKPNPAIGTQIKNAAAIYFDYNAPVLTNTVVNTIQQPVGPTSVTEEKAALFSVFPNPAKNLLTIESGRIMTEVKVLNVLGEYVKTLPVNADRLTVDMSGLAPNVYFLEIITSDQRTTVRKIVKE